MKYKYPLIALAVILALVTGYFVSPIRQLFVSDDDPRVVEFNRHSDDAINNAKTRFRAQKHRDTIQRRNADEALQKGYEKDINDFTTTRTNTLREEQDRLTLERVNYDERLSNNLEKELEDIKKHFAKAIKALK